MREHHAKRDKRKEKGGKFFTAVVCERFKIERLATFGAYAGGVTTKIVVAVRTVDVVPTEKEKQGIFLLYGFCWLGRFLFRGDISHGRSVTKREEMGIGNEEAANKLAACCGICL